MPYFYDPNLDEDNEQQAPGEVNISGASPTTDSTGNETNAPGSSTKTLNTGSGFQNLEKYLTTNQPKEFGQQVLGNVKSQVENAGTQMQQSGEQFKNQVKSANYIPSTEQVNQAVANPSGANAQEFQGWMNEKYTGPKSLPESSDIWNKYWSGTNQAQASTKALGTEPGRFTLLDQYFGRPSYNFGEKSLDNLLVQQSGLGRETRNLQNEATQLKTKGAEEAKGLQAFAGQRANEIDQNRQNVLNTIGVDAQGNVLTGANSGAIGKEYQGVYDAVKAANDPRAGIISGFRDPLQKDYIDKDTLKQHGVNLDDSLFNLNLNDYLTVNGDLSRDQVMTPEQRSRIQALSQLAGIDDTFANGQAKDKIDPYSFDFERLKADQKRIGDARMAEFHSIYDPYWEQLSHGNNSNFQAVNQALNDLNKRYNEQRRFNFGYKVPPTADITGEDDLSPRIRGR